MTNANISTKIRGRVRESQNTVSGQAKEEKVFPPVPYMDHESENQANKKKIKLVHQKGPSTPSQHSGSRTLKHQKDAARTTGPPGRQLSRTAGIS